MYLKRTTLKENRIYYLFTATIFIGLMIPILIQDGMFLDGVTYSAISKNMANGLGSIWKPHYTKALHPNFHEHPPLVFIIQSLFFRIFGTEFYVERIYSLVTAILSLIGISKCWRLFFNKKEQKHHDWMPILLWLTIPLVLWSYHNNMLENTMSVFTIFAVFSILKSLKEEKIIFLFLGGICIVSAFLSKGLVGLFPVAVPVIYAMVYKEKKISLLYFVYLIFSVSFIAFLLSMAFPGLKENITLYFEQQLLPALNNKREITTDNRFSILLDLILEISLPLILLIFVIIKQWKRERTISVFKNKRALLFLLIAIAASVPLIITLKQRKFYLISSIPFYVLAVSFWVYPFFTTVIKKVSDSSLLWIKRFSIILFFGVLIFSIIRFGKFSRDKEKLQDVYEISQIIPKGTVLTTTRELYSDWSLIAYMSRVGYLSLDINKEHEYYLIKKNYKIESKLLKEYYVMDLKLNKYTILKRKY